jgi:hypothetical protein
MLSLFYKEYWKVTYSDFADFSNTYFSSIFSSSTLQKIAMTIARQRSIFTASEFKNQMRFLVGS